MSARDFTARVFVRRRAAGEVFTLLDVRLEHELRSAGSEGFAFETIIAAGARSALPHARASRQPIAKGDLLLFDFGAIHAGYVSDITRTFVVGAVRLIGWSPQLHDASRTGDHDERDVGPRDHSLVDRVLARGRSA